MKKNFEKKRITIKMIGEKKKQKDLITYVDKPTVRNLLYNLILVRSIVLL
jgi:hypothetical protein